MSLRSVIGNTSYARGDPHPTYRVLHDQAEVEESDNNKEGEGGCCGCFTILILILGAIAIAWWLGWLKSFWSWATDMICEM
ncbi:MAG: hypothetical protein F4Y88_00695 [Chloroflexi bacterium]|nr:hypothetical protein [Chloroflexota bacterium]